MGTIDWEAYKPEDINWPARGRVEAWSRHDTDLFRSETQTRKIRVRPRSGILFTLCMLALVVGTWALYFRG